MAASFCKDAHNIAEKRRKIKKNVTLKKTLTFASDIALANSLFLTNYCQNPV